MISMILAGGMGSRLWPLSTRETPKQFLHLASQKASLLQQTHQRLTTISSAVYVVAGKEQESYVRESLPELNPRHLILEPFAHGTTNALLLFLRAIQDQPQTSLFISWADHYIPDIDQFYANVNQAQEFFKTQPGLVQFGRKPDYPTSQYGYLKVGRHVKENIYQLSQFLEKPDLSLAETFCQSEDYLWNIGYFITNFAFIEAQFKQHNPARYHDLMNYCQSSEDMLDSVFANCQKGNIDYDLSERLTGEEVSLIDCDFSFIDIGSFKNLHSLLDKDAHGNTLVGKLTKRCVTNSYLINQTDQQLAVVGLDNLVVVVTENNILIANKDSSDDIGRVAKDLSD